MLTLQQLIEAIRLVPGVIPYLTDAAKSIGMFGNQLWQYTIDLYRGEEVGVFIDKFTAAIDNQLTRAWNEGARSVGVEPKDMTEDDLGELQSIIDNEYEYILGLAEAITEYEPKDDMKAFEKTFRSRIETWVLRYTDTVNKAKLYFGGKTKLEWTLGETEEHCDTCAMLNGVIAYAEEWEQAGVHPQGAPNQALQCGGWRCDCRLEPPEGDKRRTADALDYIMNTVEVTNV